MTTTEFEITPEMRARHEAIRKQLAHKPSPEELFTPEELADASRFHFSLRECVHNLRTAREARGLSPADVAAKIGVPTDTVEWLEKGMTNPTWKLLGDYAHAVGLTLTIAATPAA